MLGHPQVPPGSRFLYGTCARHGSLSQTFGVDKPESDAKRRRLVDHRLSVYGYCPRSGTQARSVVDGLMVSPARTGRATAKRLYELGLIDRRDDEPAAPGVRCSFRPTALDGSPIFGKQCTEPSFGRTLCREHQHKAEYTDRAFALLCGLWRTPLRQLLTSDRPKATSFLAKCLFSEPESESVPAPEPEPEPEVEPEPEPESEPESEPASEFEPEPEPESEFEPESESESESEFEPESESESVFEPESEPESGWTESDVIVITDESDFE